MGGWTRGAAGRWGRCATVVAVVLGACTGSPGDGGTATTVVPGVGQGPGGTGAPSGGTPQLAQDVAVEVPEGAGAATSRQGPTDTTSSDEPLRAPTGRGSSPAPVNPSASPACPTGSPGAPGLTGTEVLLGVPRLDNQTAEAYAMARFDAPRHPLHEYIEAMAERLNRAGGIACRQVRLVWHRLDVLEGGGFGTVNEQAMCATWTQDHRVFAAFSPVDGPGEVLYPCLDRAGTLIIDVVGDSFRDTRGFSEVEHLVAVSAPRFDRGTAALAHALVRQGFLDSHHAIGIVHYDNPVSTRTTQDVLLPALAAHGLVPKQTRPVTAPRSLSDLGMRDQELANVSLRFRLDDIDRVLFVGGDGLAAGFMIQAERHRYRPHYGLSTLHLPVVVLDEVPRAQLVRSRGIGWFPDRDLAPHPPAVDWPVRAECLASFQRDGFAVGRFADRLQALYVCEAFGFLVRAVEAIPDGLSPRAVLAALDGLGDGYRSPLIDQTDFRGRRDGAVTYHDVVYRPACECFRYTGAARLIGQG